MATEISPTNLESRSIPPLLIPAVSAWRTSEGRIALGGAIGSLGLLGLVFSSNLEYFAYTWRTDDNYSHGFLVPLLSLYFANEAARKGPIAVRSGVLLGSVLLVIAVLGELATIVIPVGFVGHLSFLIGLAGCVCLIAGSGALVRYRFAIAFLVFMIPLPIALYSAIASPLQLLVSKVASASLNALDVPVLCEGNTMTLPNNVRMFVAEACSGMRQMTGFLALTTAFAFFSDRPGWYRLVLVLASIPIALTANVVRVILTGVIMYWVDPRFASGAWHTFEGLMMMLFGLALLLLFHFGLEAIGGRSRPFDQAEPVGSALAGA